MDDDLSMIDHDYEPNQSDRIERAMVDCGFSTELGFCSMVGSEQCDWDCPIMEVFGVHGEKFFTKQAASDGGEGEA